MRIFTRLRWVRELWVAMRRVIIPNKNKTTPPPKLNQDARSKSSKKKMREKRGENGERDRRKRKRMREERGREGRNDQTKCIFRWGFAENVF